MVDLRGKQGKHRPGEEARIQRRRPTARTNFLQQPVSRQRRTRSIEEPVRQATPQLNRIRVFQRRPYEQSRKLVSNNKFQGPPVDESTNSLRDASRSFHEVSNPHENKGSPAKSEHV